MAVHIGPWGCMLTRSGVHKLVAIMTRSIAMPSMSAFLNFIAFEEMHASQEMARLAFEHAGRAERSIWSVATEAEALLYLGDLVTAVAKYKEAAAQRAEPWQLISAGQQAQQIATKLQDTSLQSELQAIFDAKPPISRIFISCSHKDRHWVDELTTMMKPLLKETDQVALWDDSHIQSGSKWRDDIRQAHATSRVAVLLVTAEFLASDFISKQELPVILESHKNGKTRIVWVYVSAAPYEVTPLNDLQAANDISKPLEDMTRPEQRQALKTIAFKIKEAVFE